MAQSEVKQEPQFAVLADHVSFTIISVDSELGQIHVDIHADELREDPKDQILDAWNYTNDEPLRLQIARDVFEIVRNQRQQESDVSQQLARRLLCSIKSRQLLLVRWRFMSVRYKMTANHFDPLLTQTSITTIFHEDDFDFQFENLTKELAELEESEVMRNVGSF